LTPRSPLGLTPMAWRCCRAACCARPPDSGRRGPRAPSAT
jgi:hypothetical protein